jgi:DNA-binding LytR/AlgR family response regulator
MKLNCIIVDDEPIARKGMAEYVNEIDFLQLVSECDHPLKAASILTDHTIDLIYLDIQMPKLTGIEFLKGLNNPPLVILTTAFSSYALEGYALDVVDYLVKPIPFERFFKASQKAYEIMRLKTLANERLGERNYFFIKCDNKYEKIFLDDVLYIKAMENYVVIHTRDQKKFITYLTMTGMEQQLPQDRFLKIHKSYIVGLTHIRAVDGNEVLIGEDRIPISRHLKDKVLDRIMGDRLFKR